MFQMNNSIETLSTSLKAANTSQLRTGQFIHGKVLSLLPENKAILSVNGSKLLARLEVPISQGENAWFMVMPPENGEVKLKWMKGRNKNLNFSELINGVIKQFNLKNSKTNQNLITELIRNQIPINKDVVNNLVQLLDNDTSITDVLHATKLLLDRNLPISSHSIRAVHEFINGEGLMQKITQLNDEIAFLPLSSKNSIESLLEQTTQKGKELLEIVKLDKEISKDQILPRLIKYFKEIDVRNTQTEVELIPEQQTITLKKSLEQLYTIKDNLPNKILTKLEESLYHITGQQLLTIPDHSPINQTVFQFPGFLPFSTEPTYIQVHSKKKQNQVIDPEDLRLVFLFQLTNLGDMMVEVNIYQKQLSIQVFGDAPYTKEYVKKFEPFIIENIKSYGYQISGVSVKSFRQKSGNKNQSSFINPYKGVDIKI